MTPLAPSDLVHFEMAQIHFKAERLAEAAQRLRQISPSALENHPDLLEFQWELCASQGDWETALRLAILLCASFPENHSSWTYHACALNELNRTPEAWNLLISAAEKFPALPEITYNLACCGCKLGRLDEAAHWLAQTMNLSGRGQVKLMALNDPDLSLLWPQLCQ